MRPGLHPQSISESVNFCILFRLRFFHPSVIFQLILAFLRSSPPYFAGFNGLPVTWKLLFCLF
jgi:hypothetical protein